jgi:hypothetical protein
MMAWLSESVVAEDRPDHQIRSNGHIVQDRPLRSVRWADIPQLPTRDRCCLAAWQQYWQQSRRNGLDPPDRLLFRPDVSPDALADLPVISAEAWSTW